MANLFSEKPIVKVVMLKGQDGEEKLINQADGSGLSFWIGTQAEYDAIPEAELISDCVYYITDDTRDDFNTRLNELDTKVDNNTTAIADNTENIATNTADLANLLFKYGDTGTMNYLGAGYITNVSKGIRFSIPLPKILPPNLKIEFPDVGDFKYKVRQNGIYVIGTETEYYEESPTLITINSNGSFINISINHSTEMVAAINNETAGIECIINFEIVNA